MNKYTAILSTVLVLTSQNLSVTAHAATPNYAQATATETTTIPTYTLNQIVTQSFSTDTLNASVVQVATPVKDPVVETPQEIAERLVTAHYGAGHFTAFAKIVNRESTWNPNAVNRSSGACGLGQALPCSKVPDQSVEGQLNWMIAYIDQRYGTPEKAWHAEQTKGWY